MGAIDEPPVTTSEAVTEGVRVHVRARYSPEHSDPGRSEWFFLYTIRITNEGSDTVQLTDRHWYIVDGSGSEPTVGWRPEWLQFLGHALVVPAAVLGGKAASARNADGDPHDEPAA